MIKLVIITLTGLSIGSFLNVIIYRLPHALLQEKTLGFFTWIKRSHCTHCQHALTPLDLIPMISFFLRRCHCAYCKKKISWHYLLIEGLTATLASLLFYYVPLWQASALFIFFCLTLCLAIIDWKYFLLPDELTYPLLWFGLIVNINHLTTSINHAIWGALLAYLSLWCLAKLYYACTKENGMGHGDFKLAAAISAWLGWKSIPLLFLTASMLAITSHYFYYRIKKTPHIPFGFYLVTASWIILLEGDNIAALIMLYF